MIKQRREPTLIQERESTPAGQQGLAAARLASLVRSTLHRALEASGTSQKALAERLGVGESRISQVFSGNGNIQISTFAKVMRALGYKIEFVVEPVDSSVPEIPTRGRRPRRERQSPAQTDRVTVTRAGQHGMLVGCIDFTVSQEDNEAFYMLTTRDSTVTARSAGWEMALEIPIAENASTEKEHSLG